MAVIVAGETVYLFNTQNSPLGYALYMSPREPLMMPSWASHEVPDYNNFNNWHPKKELEQFYRSMACMFHDSLARDFQNDRQVFSDRNSFFMSEVNVKETPGSYIISVDLPGMNKEDIKVERRGDLLTISGERKSEEKTQNQKIYRDEQNYGYFSRALTLPPDVKMGGIRTEYNNGVLKIVLQKASEAIRIPGPVIKVPVQ